MINVVVTKNKKLNLAFMRFLLRQWPELCSAPEAEPDVDNSALQWLSAGKIRADVSDHTSAENRPDKHQLNNKSKPRITQIFRNYEIINPLFHMRNVQFIHFQPC